MKSERFSLLRMIVYSLTILAFLVVRVGQADSFEPILSLFSAISIVLSVFWAGRFAQLMAFLFIGLGTWFVCQSGIGAADYLLLYGEMMFMLALFALVPLLSLPIKLGGYEESIRELLGNRLHSVGQMHRMITSFSFLLGTFLNMATLPLMHQISRVLTSSVRVTNTNRFVTTSVVQGYTLPIMWTPISGIMGVVVEATGVRWLAIFPILLLLTIAGLVMYWVLFRLPIPWLNPYEREGADHSDSTKHASAHDLEAIRKLLHIFAAIVSLILIVLFTDYLFSIGLVIAVTLAAFPFAFVWALLLREGSALVVETGSYFRKQVPKMSESFLVLLSAGFFLRAIQYSGMDAAFNQSVLQWIEWVGSLGLLLGMPILIVLLSFLGVNPVITITLLASSIQPELLGISVEEMAVAFLGGAMLTYVVGPYSGAIGLMSILSGDSVFRIARWGAVHAAVFYILLVITLILMG